MDQHFCCRSRHFYGESSATWHMASFAAVIVGTVLDVKWKAERWRWRFRWWTGGDWRRPLWAANSWLIVDHQLTNRFVGIYYISKA